MSFSVLAVYGLAILVGSFLLSYLFSIVSRRFAIKINAVDVPRVARKIHKQPIPLLGGLGIGLAILIGCFILAFNGWIILPKLTEYQIIGFAIGIIILNVGGLLDDKYELKPWKSIWFPIAAALIIIMTGTTIKAITTPGTTSAFYLNWFNWKMGWLSFSFPSDLLTFVWLMVAMYATKITDGLDGLVAGITVIGAAMVGALSAMPTFYQPSSALLAATVAGSYLGFLPKNFHPAKQFLGEGGSTMAGFCLGFLAIVSSAKVAIALVVLGIPIADVFFVALRRILQHKSPFSGDKSHLHFRLLDAGLPHSRTVLILWLVSAVAGTAALFLQTRGKMFLILLLAILTLLVSWFADKRIRERNNQNAK